MPLEVIRSRTLQVTVWNYDNVKENDFLGAAFIALSELDLSSEHTAWYPLQAMHYVSTSGKWRVSGGTPCTISTPLTAQQSYLRPTRSRRRLVQSVCRCLVNLYADYKRAWWRVCLTMRVSEAEHLPDALITISVGHLFILVLWHLFVSLSNLLFWHITAALYLGKLSVLPFLRFSSYYHYYYYCYYCYYVCYYCYHCYCYWCLCGWPIWWLDPKEFSSLPQLGTELTAEWQLAYHRCWWRFCFYQW